MNNHPHGKTRKRQYRLSVSTLAELSRYCLEEGIKQSEVVELAVKEFLKKGLLRTSAFVAFLILSRQCDLWAGGLDSVSESGIVQRLGNIISMIAGIVAPVVLAAGLLIGGIKYHDGDEEAMSYIKGGVIGGFISFAAWGIAKWLLTGFQ